MGIARIALTCRWLEAMSLPDFSRQNTVPRLFWHQVERYRNRVAIWRKYRGMWESLTWGDYGEWVKDVANGLLLSGLKPGERVSILAQTRWEWVVCDMAIISIGCVTVPIYHSNTVEQTRYIVEHSKSSLVFVEDQEQLDKLMEIMERSTCVKSVVVMDGYQPEDLPGVRSWDSLRRAGREFELAYPGVLRDRYLKVQPDDIISFIYTSGTTGPPKAAMINSRNVIAIIKYLPGLLKIGQADSTIAYLPLAHIAERVVGHFLKLAAGNQTIFAESIEDLPHNLRQTGPTIMFGTPRIFEKFYARIATGINDATAFQRIIYNWAIGVGKTVSAKRIKGKKLSWPLIVKKSLAHFLIFRKIQAFFGGKIRFLISGGAPISPEIIRYFHWVGLDIYEVYGMTETTGLIAMNFPGACKIGSVGTVFPGTEVKIGSDGEICARGQQMSPGYYRNNEATAELLEPDSNNGYWLHTGDIGFMDDEGYLHITDRKKDIIITAGGKNVAPQNIENLLKTSPYISQAMVYGDKKPYLIALITLDEDEIAKFARDREILYQDLTDLSGKPEVKDLIHRTVHEKNRQLASYETIKKFAILEEDFDQDKDEVTPTLKVKRKVVISRYRELLEGMYS